VLSGLSFGLAIGSRPHLGVAAAAVFFLLIRLPESCGPISHKLPLAGFARRLVRTDVLPFTSPVVLCAAAIAAYNYARFDNPLEFGTRYLLGADAYRNFHMSVSNVDRGLYYLLVCAPDLVPESPFIRLALRPPFHPFTHAIPAGYFLERIAGSLTLAPPALLAPVFLCPKLRTDQRAAFGFLGAMLASAIGTLLILAAVPFSSQRYEVDFLPYLSC